MNRRILGSIAVALLLVSGSAYAERTRAARPPQAATDDTTLRGPVADAITRCLAVVELTEAQRLQIRQIFMLHGPELARLGQQLAESHRAFLALAAEEGANVCDVGAAYMKVEADRKALEAAAASLRPRIEAILTHEQKLKLEGCLAGVSRPRP
jgi:Spy/CpxP family protein refolding chaperone